MILLLLAHPNPESFNHALAKSATRRLEAIGLSVQCVDLYRMPPSTEGESRTEAQPFPAVLDREELLRKTSLDPLVQRQMFLLEEARGYVVIHPDWWGGAPAVLKGWLDRVLRPETAYTAVLEGGETRFEGLLAGRRALVLITGDGEAGPLEAFWTERVWGFCGVSARVQYISSPGRMSSVERRGWLHEAATLVESWLHPGSPRLKRPGSPENRLEFSYRAFHGVWHDWGGFDGGAPGFIKEFHLSQ